MKNKIPRWTAVKFGKHEGKTLPQILFRDPDWFFYMYSQGAFAGNGDLEAEAEEIYRKARAIKVPPGYKALFIIHSPTGKFGTLQVVPSSELEHGEPMLHVIVKDVIDMEVPITISSYDKTGYKSLIGCLKLFLFEDRSRRMTKSRCEEFFEEDDNFAV